LNSNNSSVDQIREIVIEQGKREPQNAFHVISNLNWNRYNKQVDYLEACLPSGKVLDIGCGWGHTTAMIASVRPDIEIMGLDLKRAIAWDDLNKYGPKFQVGDALDLPFVSEQFDAVISFGSMEHTNNENSFLSEVNRVLKPGKLVTIFNLPNEYAISERMGIILGLEHHLHRYNRHQIKLMFSNAGFEIILLNREHIIPAQVDRINQKIGNIFNRHYIVLNKVDNILMKSPLCLLAENWMIQAQKSR
jgi:2-polyprenyl-3-methyl-5-hydroxy-6-metoxy-1,4-benzoquinol methylase